nr:hypothetical protein [uncultured organism]
MEAEALSPIMDALSGGKEPKGSLADIARAGRLLVEHERETAGADREALINSLHARYGKDARASEGQNQAVEYSDDASANEGKGKYLDTDILDGWAAERKPSPRSNHARIVFRAVSISSNWTGRFVFC